MMKHLDFTLLSKPPAPFDMQSAACLPNAPTRPGMRLGAMAITPDELRFQADGIIL
jgi:hypothetical protein